MLSRSGVLDQLHHFSFGPHGEIPFIYGDPAEPIRAHLQTPFKSLLQISWNKEMSSAQLSVEWVFGNIINYFEFLTSEKYVSVFSGLVPITLLKYSRACTSHVISVCIL